MFSVDECVRLVSKSVHPVVILGSQSTLPPVPAEKLRQALEVSSTLLLLLLNYYSVVLLYVMLSSIAE